MISHKTFMRIAYTIAEESYCEKRKVGAIIVKNNSIIAVGYNGTPSGFENCCEDDGVTTTELELNKIDLSVIFVQTTEKKTRPEVLHAESNAISKCARSTLSSEGAEIYTTTAPCIECSKLIIQAGITHVFYCEEYKDAAGLELLNKAGIKIERIEPVFPSILRIEPTNLTPEQQKDFRDSWDKYSNQPQSWKYIPYPDENRLPHIWKQSYSDEEITIKKNIELEKQTFENTTVFRCKNSESETLTKLLNKHYEIKEVNYGSKR